MACENRNTGLSASLRQNQSIVTHDQDTNYYDNVGRLDVQDVMKSGVSTMYLRQFMWRNSAGAYIFTVDVVITPSNVFLPEENEAIISELSYWTRATKLTEADEDFKTSYQPYGGVSRVSDSKRYVLTFTHGMLGDTDKGNWFTIGIRGRRAENKKFTVTCHWSAGKLNCVSLERPTAFVTQLFMTTQADFGYGKWWVSNELEFDSYVDSVPVHTTGRLEPKTVNKEGYGPYTVLGPFTINGRLGPGKYAVRLIISWEPSLLWLGTAFEFGVGLAVNKVATKLTIIHSGIPYGSSTQESRSVLTGVGDLIIRPEDEVAYLGSNLYLFVTAGESSQYLVHGSVSAMLSVFPRYGRLKRSVDSPEKTGPPSREEAEFEIINPDEK